jgi:hypothetical protein
MFYDNCLEPWHKKSKIWEDTLQTEWAQTIQVFWDAMLCHCEWFLTFQRSTVTSSSSVSSAWGFEISHCLTLEDESSMILQNVGTSRPMTPKDLDTGSFNKTCINTGSPLHLTCKLTYYINIQNILFFQLSALYHAKCYWIVDNQPGHLCDACMQLTRKWNKDGTIIRGTQLLSQ